MNGATKIALYTILIILACVSGLFASRNFKAIMDRSEERVEIDAEENKNSAQSETASTDTNAAPAETETNAAPAEATPDESAAVDTNAAANVETNAPATNSAAATSAKEPEKEVPTALGTTKESPAAKTRGGMGLWTGIFLLSVVGLGILLALDIAHMFGNRALKTLYNDEGEGIGNPDYELAEKEWSNGNHLQAIQMMREYLAKNPREQHVALRIAEIYEKDLNNHLAAALEYEEVLTKKLAPERWGWAAIHLCNLYFKLGQEQKAFALLRRVVTEHPDVPAAEKARKRLEQVDAAAGSDSAPVSNPTKETNDAKPPVRVAAPQPPQSNLPPGFRPKK